MTERKWVATSVPTMRRFGRKNAKARLGSKFHAGAARAAFFGGSPRTGRRDGGGGRAAAGAFVLALGAEVSRGVSLGGLELLADGFGRVVAMSVGGEALAGGLLIEAPRPCGLAHVGSTFL